ncbi:carbon storage regulator [Tautonia sociabilis]|uniref:Translational regulator CsrA n=1 Tax=Tautonia sociabilis TaxID=2080755 RepID=A0A432MGY8_9BACT|nr:carbon storage regulator [Tautonia sociabilis]RUL86096.1 carbon storage regulator [Tautonia sociabilis]
MLVLSRTSSQDIMVGDSIRITVVAIAGGRVRLGIDAPQDVAVIRGELARTEDSSGPPGGDPPTAPNPDAAGRSGPDGPADPENSGRPGNQEPAP